MLTSVNERNVYVFADDNTKSPESHSVTKPWLFFRKAFSFGFSSTPRMAFSS